MIGSLTVVVGPPTSGKTTIATALQQLRGGGVVLVEDIDAGDFTLTSTVLAAIAEGTDVVATSVTVVDEDLLERQGIDRAKLLVVHAGMFAATLGVLLGKSSDEVGEVLVAAAAPLTYLEGMEPGQRGG